MIERCAERGRVRVRICCLRMGADLCVAVSGGDREHIGAVALAQPHPGETDPGKREANASVIAVAGHREDDLARRVASRLASRFGCTVSVACGIHVDRILPNELEDALELVYQLTDELIDALSQD